MRRLHFFSLLVVLFCSAAKADDINDIARTYLYLNAEIARSEVTPGHLAVLRSWRDKAQDLVTKMNKTSISPKLKTAQNQLIDAMGSADIKLWEQQEFRRQWAGCWSAYGGIELKSTDGKAAVFHELEQNQFFVDTPEGSFLLPRLEGPFPRHVQLYFGSQSARVEFNKSETDIFYFNNSEEPGDLEKITLIKAVKDGADRIHQKILKKSMGATMEALLLTGGMIKINTELLTTCKKTKTVQCQPLLKRECKQIKANLQVKCDDAKEYNQTLGLINERAHDTLEKVSKSCGEYLTPDEKTDLAQFLQRHPVVTEPHESASSAQ